MDRDLALSGPYRWKGLKIHDKDDLWTEIRPSQVYITERDRKPIDIGILTAHALRSGPLKFLSQIGT